MAAETPESNASLAGELRKISVFSDLPDEHFTWLASQFQEIRLEPGQVFVRAGDPADSLTVLLEGEIRLQREDNPDAPVFSARAGQVTGLLPYSRLTHYRGTGRAVIATRLARLHRDHFPEMLQRMPQLGQRLVGIMADRIREVERLEQQRDKLMALGKLSAGLAHELNNPAAAAGRAASSLRESLEAVRDASLRLARHSLSNEQREFIARFEREAGRQPDTAPSDPLAQSDREERITDWLDTRRVPDAWKIAPVLADAGVETPRLERLADVVGEQALGEALARIASLLTVIKLVGEIEVSARRISELVRAVKEYSYMDQSPVQEIDVHQGIESTLVILAHRLKKGIAVIREFDKNIPRICAYGAELNQVWTNLMDNAIDAMQGRGELRIRTARELDRVLVEIGDNGPGIPPDVLPRVFEPFYTTKGLGEGTGLGLDMVCRIVRKHHGDIRVESQPGDTRFQVRLPVEQPKTSS